MRLLVDIGNSRVKWALQDGDAPGPQQAADHSNWQADDWQRALFAQRGIDAVLAASTSTAAAALLDAAARRATGRAAEFVRSTREAAGVRNAYRDPGLLGVDRWLAVIAAHARVPGPCCVADFGTATTFDAVAADGTHLGGYIVPGPSLMVASLHAGTSDLAQRAAASGTAGEAPLADNTREAIERGCRLAAAALVDRGVRDVAARLGAAPRLLVTGGAAGRIVPLLLTPAEVVEDLVIQGLAALSRSSP
jgi:type III pantothenate kinase